MNDNLLYVINTIRSNLLSLSQKSNQVRGKVGRLDSEIDSCVLGLKRKVGDCNRQIDSLDEEVLKLNAKLDKLLGEMEIYKTRLNREKDKDIRRIREEMAAAAMASDGRGKDKENPTNPVILDVASTVAIFECILRSMCKGADDFSWMSKAILFPSIYERLTLMEDEAYLLERMPNSAGVVVKRGMEYLEWIRSECPHHLTEPSSWDKYVGAVSDWWKNDALPLLYGCRDDAWDSDVPLSLAEMTSWKEDPSIRPISFPKIWDTYEIFEKHKDEIYERSGVREFDMKNFHFGASA